MESNVKLTNTNYCKETLALKTQIESAFLTLGERLYKIREDQLWDGGWNSYAEFVQEMGMSEATASKLVHIHTQLILEYGLERAKIAQMGMDKAYTILPLCDTKTGALKAISQALVLRRDDVRDLVRIHQKGEHTHDLERVTYDRCVICFKTFKVFDAR